MTVLGHLLSTGTALLLLRRGSSKRLRLLTLTVALMSLSQTLFLLEAVGQWGQGASLSGFVHQFMMVVLPLIALYLLRLEIRDRYYSNKSLQVVEYVAPSGDEAPVEDKPAAKALA
ncbi:MAG: hypothetical protein HYZ37_09830 [Candidatus Solibacter usitatus]|nr:hypothetical protein [Candidatus Solibacter usitatus]